MIDRDKMRVGEDESGIGREPERGTAGESLRELGPDVLSCY